MPRRAIPILLLAVACPDAGQQTGPDGGQDDGPATDLEPPEGDGPAALAVDFTVAGCPMFEAATPRCSGVAPLTVTLVPVTSPAVGTFLWDFGDKTPPSSARTPVHTFTLPGKYDLTLTVGAAADTASRTRREFIVAAPAATGAPCDVSAQCEAGRTCLCAPGSPGCPSAFARGLCTLECTEDCPSGAVCADLALSAQSDAMAARDPWRKLLCLRSCDDDADCAAGLHCRDLPAVPLSSGWLRACFAGGLLGDVGASCRSAAGLLRDAECVTGHCGDLGALGICSRSCTGGECSPGSRCARMGNGGSLCLQSCAAAADCPADPLLGCEAAGAPGALGFTFAIAPSTGSSCAPRRCTADADCRPSGRCVTQGGGAHCVR